MTYAAPGAIAITPQVIAISNPWCAYSGFRVGFSPNAPISSTNPVANQAIYVPFVVTSPATFRRGFWYNGSAPGDNVSVGIYTPDGTRRATTGAVLAAGASVIQDAAFTANYDAAPGIYYMAISYSVATLNGCFAYAAALTPTSVGVLTEAAGVHPLPATAVFATWSSMVMPVFGITQTSFAI